MFVLYVKKRHFEDKPFFEESEGTSSEGTKISGSGEFNFNDVCTRNAGSDRLSVNDPSVIIPRP